MHIIGTAGHVDHGKSTLIRVLTGIDPDRLQEEKERGMTIDLGFAFITLPSGREAGIVDVPGHHRFIRNMLAGVSGIDMVLFVVAATESWMPQSQEHLDIINLLGIDRGLVVLTKADLVEPDWLQMVAEEVREKLAGTALADAQIVPVSSTTGEGLERLKAEIDAVLAEIERPLDTGRPRLWIDRVFTMRGAGTVVTGTLEGGSLAIDQSVTVLPSGQVARVRGLQTYHRPVQVASPGTRVAVNLSGVDTESLQRGDALVAGGAWAATDTVNATLTLLPALQYSLPHESELKLYVGSAELLAHVRLLEQQELLPGETGLVQIRLERQAAICFHDRIIVRDATRQETVGGGRILDSRAERVRGRDLRLPRTAPGAYRVLSTAKVPVRRLDLDLLRQRATAGPQDLIGIILAERGWAAIDELALEVPLAGPELRDSLAKLAQARRLVLLPGHAVAPDTWEALAARLCAELSAYHQRYPLRAGLNRETLRSTVGMEARLYEEAVARMVEDGVLAAAGALLRLPDFRPQFTVEQELQASRVVDLLSASGYSPPELDELTAGSDAEVVNVLIEQGRLVKIGKGIVFLSETLEEAKQRIATQIAAEGSIDVGAVRDILGTTRKYAVPLLEYLDQIGFTRRVGDRRILT